MKRAAGARQRKRYQQSPEAKAKREAREAVKAERTDAALADRIEKAERQRERWAHRIGPPIPPRIRQRIKMRTDPGHVLNQRMRVAIRKAMKGGKAGRQWESILGYTLADLVAHLAPRLPAGYAMGDFFGGRLHIDHIVPKWTFDVTTPEGLRDCWALSNLQPLTAADNLRKGRKLAT